MKSASKITAILIAATLIAGPALSESFKRIRTESDYRRIVVGKTTTAGSAHFIVHSDGTITGEIPKGPVRGNWKWNRKFFLQNRNHRRQACWI